MALLDACKRHSLVPSKCTSGIFRCSICRCHDTWWFGSFWFRISSLWFSFPSLPFFSLKYSIYLISLLKRASPNHLKALTSKSSLHQNHTDSHTLRPRYKSSLLPSKTYRTKLTCSLNSVRHPSYTFLIHAFLPSSNSYSEALSFPDK